MSSLIYSNTWLCSAALALGRVGPSGLAINGSQVNDVVTYLKATSVTVFPRGGRANSLSFLVQAAFATLSAADQYAALHFGQLPQQGDLICTDEADNPLWSLPDACIVAVRARLVGVTIYLEYSFTGGAFESEDIILPDGDSDLVKAQRIALTNGDVEKVFAWDAAFAAAPRGLHPTLIIPTGGAAFGIVVDKDTITAAGGLLKFDAAVPGDGYEISLLGVL